MKSAPRVSSHPSWLVDNQYLDGRQEIISVDNGDIVFDIIEYPVHRHRQEV